MTKLLRAALYVFLTLVASGLPHPALAQDGPHRAGVVVTHDDGATVTRCVSFAEDAISGYELLARSGLDLAVEANATGATVCSLDGQGCAFPEKSCFCQCQGSPCVYWSYWRLADVGWTYQTIGAGGTKVSDGTVEGWRWGAGTVDSATEPPQTSLAEICGEGGEVEQGKASAAVTASIDAGSQASMTTAALRSATPSAGPAAVSEAATAVPAATAVLWVVLIVVVGGPLIAAAVYATRRRSRS